MKNINHLKSDSPALQLVDCETLAAKLSVSEKFVRKKTAEGFFPCFKLSRRCVRWDVAAVERIIAEYRINANSES